MRLQSIKLAGFKSFVDPTTVTFATNLSAVVGPNGCGKSNIIDAVRWVMGESSARQLRGEQMADVIFNGSTHRKPVGQASIELLFDNSAGSLGGEYARFAEISIRRKVTRAGQSSYYLNGVRCRRRDIVDIFLGTGLGPRSYAIIEQGMISHLIEARPDDLRVYIEEAAGISKYKERRRETENRMQHTKENLQRINDIKEELQRQLQTLERQARAAQKYRELKEEERSQRIRLAALRWRALEQQRLRLDDEVSKESLLRDGLLAEQSRLERELEQLRLRHLELHEAFNLEQGHYYRQGAEISRLEQGIRHAQERARQLHTTLADNERQMQALHAQQAHSQQLGTTLSDTLQDLTPRSEAAQVAEQQAAQQLAATEQRMQQWQEGFDRLQREAQLPARQTEAARATLRQIEQQLPRLKSRIERLHGERDSLRGQIDDTALPALRQRFDQLADEIRLSEVARQASEQRRQQLRQQRNALQPRLDQLRRLDQQLSGRISSLETLQQAALGRGRLDPRQTQLLQRLELDRLPRLGERLEVEAGWEGAIERLLVHRIRALCLPAERADEPERLMAALFELPLALLTTAHAPAQPPPARWPRLSERLRSSHEIADWLHGGYCADNLASALDRRGQLGPGEFFLTPDALLIGRHAIERLPDDREGGGALLRARELTELKREQQQLKEQLQDAQQQLEEFDRHLRQCEAELAQTQSRTTEQRRQQATLQADLSARQARIEQSQHRITAIDEELTSATREIDEDQARQARTQAALNQAIAQSGEFEQQRQRLRAEQEQLREALAQARSHERDCRDQQHRLALERQRCLAELKAAQAQSARLEQEIERATAQRQQLQMAIADLVEPQQALQQQLDQALAAQLMAEQRLAAARQAVEQSERQQREQEDQRRHLDSQLRSLTQQVDEKRLQLRELALHDNALAEQLRSLGSSVDLIAGSEEPLDAMQLEQALERLLQRIDRLGAINLAAIDEHRIQSERKGYLEAQQADLGEALETLQEAIRKIDRETRSRFRDTFDQINRGLQALFPKVFGGGHAELVLTSDELLDSGVAIMAQPPGKRNSTIHLLSGGEKALTAIALVFAIFQLNPAPFCLLDEVDAPLDDANVGRYVNLVREMSHGIQFIYITHNKIAMEMAHQLLGVTMQEPGVSRLVTVDIEAAQALAGA